MARKSIKQLKPYIKKLYVEEGLDVPAIARELGLNPKSIYNYVNANDGQWQKEREELGKRSLKTPELLTKALEDQIEKLGSTAGAEGVALIADSISKITKTIKSLYKDRDRLAETLNIMRDFGSFVRQQAKHKTLPDDFFDNLSVLLTEFQAYAIDKYSVN